MLDFFNNMQEIPPRDYSYIVEDLSQFTYCRENSIPDDKINCRICMCEFEHNERIVIMPCAHLFHKDCIRDWFKKKNNCPICQNEVRE